MSRAVFKISVGFVLAALILVTASLYVSGMYMDRQQQFAASGNVAGAIGAASAAARFDPFTAEPFQAEAALLDNRERPGDAERAMERAATRDPNNFVVVLSIGNLRMEQGDLEGAEEAYRRAVQLNPLSSVAKEGLAQALIRQGKLQRAGEIYQDLKERKQIGTLGLYNLGRIYVRNERAEEGFKLIRQAERRATRELETLSGESRESQERLIDSMELAAVDALVVQREYDRAYRLVLRSSSSQAAALAQLIATDPERYRQSVIEDEIY